MLGWKELEVSFEDSRVLLSFNPVCDRGLGGSGNVLGDGYAYWQAKRVYPLCACPPPASVSRGDRRHRQ